MAIKIKLRRDTSLNWQTNNPVLDEGEPGFETDTLRFKVGNGDSPWNTLNYVKFAGFINDIEGLDTANVEENVNLYFTNSRSYANVIQIGFTSNAYLSNILTTKANISDLNTTKISEGANLYFTNVRAVSAFTPSDKVIISSNGYITISVQDILAAGNVASVNGLTGVVNLTTANINEDTNLYYTDTKVYANVLNIRTFDSNESNLIFTANGLSGQSVEVFGSPFRVASFTYEIMLTIPARTGQIIFETSNNVFRGFNGTNWAILG